MIHPASPLLLLILPLGAAPQAPADPPPATVEVPPSQKPPLPIAELAERIRQALCPGNDPRFYRTEYFDRRPSVNLKGEGLWRGYRLVFSSEVDVYLTDEDPRPDRLPDPFPIREYVEVVLFPETPDLPAGTRDAILWTGFTSLTFVKAVDMGTGLGCHWYARMHLWEQEDLRWRLRLQGGDDRHALAREAQGIRDRGGMTRNSMVGRVDRPPPK